VFRAAEGYPEAFRRRGREGIRAYVDIVLGEEWALQARGRMNDVGWRAIEALFPGRRRHRAGGLGAHLREHQASRRGVVLPLPLEQAEDAIHALAGEIHGVNPIHSRSCRERRA
jgi:hypothetical protein